MPNLIHFFIHFDHADFVKLFVVDRLPLVELLLNALVKVKVNDLVNHQDERPGKAALQLLPQKELPHRTWLSGAGTSGGRRGFRSWCLLQ